MSGLATVSHLSHLTRRFVGSLSPMPPSASDERWARDRLTKSEQRVWVEMCNQDRRHAIAVARAVDDGLRPDVLGSIDRNEALAAALLHDSGKVASGFGTFARVAATLLWALVPDDRAERWLTVGGLRSRFARYRQHPDLGRRRLASEQARPLVAAWAGDHHAPEAAWTVPVPLGRLLKACDDD